MIEGKIEGYKFNELMKQNFLELLRSGSSRKAALEACDVTRYTLYNHMAADCDFKKDVEEAEAESIDMVEDALFTKALNGNTTAQIFFLKCRRPQKWNDKPSSGDGGFSREELEQRIEQLIEIAVRRLPEGERAGFVNDLRRLAGLAEGGRESLEAPAPAAD